MHGPGGVGIRVVAVLLSFFWLCACAGPGTREARPSPPTGPARVAALVAGEYAGRLRDAPPGGLDVSGEPSANPLVHLDASIESRSGSSAVLRLSQRTGDSPARQFLMELVTTNVATRLEGRFAPLGPDGQPLGECPLEVSLQNDGFVARTDSGTCTFGEGRDAVALVKEIAGDGRRLVIGDRIVDPGNGARASVGNYPDRILELQRVREFRGWAGARDTPGDPWRMAGSIRIASDGVPVRPAGAGGMSLGVELELAPYHAGAEEASLLRLRVFDAGTGELLGQSWADPGATRIGLALPAVQVGLRLPGDQ